MRKTLILASLLALLVFNLYGQNQENNKSYKVSMPKCITYMTYYVSLENNCIAIKPHKFNFINDTNSVYYSAIKTVSKRSTLGIFAYSLVIKTNNSKYRMKFSSKKYRNSFYDSLKTLVKSDK